MDFPAKSHFQSDFLITLKGVEFWSGEQKEWNSYNYHTYVVLTSRNRCYPAGNKTINHNKKISYRRECRCGKENQL